MGGPVQSTGGQQKGGLVLSTGCFVISLDTLIHSCSLSMSCAITPGVAIGSFLVLVASGHRFISCSCRLFVGGHRPSDVLSLRFIHDTHSDPPVGMCLF